FGDGDPVGQTIRVNSVNLKVVGVLAAKGSQSQGNQDDMVYVPLTTAQTRLSRSRTASGGNTVNQVNVQLVDSKSTTKDAAVQAIGDLLRTRHKAAQDDFT